MHRFTTRRVPLWLAASALLAAGGVVAANPAAQAQPQIDAIAVCALAPADLATAVGYVNDPANGLFGYTPVVGTAAADDGHDATHPILKGTGGNEVIWGLAGADILKGAGGNDILCGGTENDELKGGSGTNHLNGEAGDDTVKGGSGTDYLYGHADDTTNPAKLGSGPNFLCPNAAPDPCVGM